MKSNHSRQDRDKPYLNLLPETPQPLVFIMGCHRSGTSLLYHLLARTGKVNYLSVYDVVYYHELLYNRMRQREEQARARLDRSLALLKDRGLDRLAVSAAAPEEYRFILAEFYIPLSLRASKRTEFFAPHLTAHTLARFAELCRKKRFLAQTDGQERPLVLKNPNDFYCHFMMVYKLLPHARFIFLHRHPLQILNSHLHSFRAALETRSDYYALLDPGYRRLFDRLPFRRVIARIAMGTGWYARLIMAQLANSLAYYCEQIHYLPVERFVSLAYEDLCREPQTCLARIGELLALDVGSDGTGIVEGPRRLAVSNQARRAYRAHVHALSPYLRRLKYEETPF